MKIIDFRFRPNIPSTVQGMIDHPVFGEMHALFKFHERARSQPIEDIVRDMEAQNVVKGVITRRDAETTYGIASGNKGVIPFLEQYPDRFIGMAGLDPHKGMDAIDELGLMVETHGFRGAAIDPFLAKIPANHAKYYPIYAKCCEFDIPVVISTGMATLVDGADPEHCHPRYIDAVARDFPKLKIVVSHGCYPWVNEIIMVVQRNRNVYLELSEYEQSPFSEGYIQAANTMIGDKVIFASAHPFLDFKGQIALYRKLPFSPQALENIFYNNAAKLLGL